MDITTTGGEGPVLEADVYKAGTLAARLTRTPEGVSFAYRADYLASSTTEHSAIATTLPLSDVPLLSPSGAVPPFFAGLLPEGRRLTSLRRRIKTSLDDELSLLVAIGNDTVGDVQVVARDASPDAIPQESLPLINPSSISFYDLLADDIPLDGVGLAGVQDKVSGKNIAVPVKHKNRDTILKLSPPEYPHLVENEAFFLTLAKRAGMPCVNHSVIRDRDGVSGLLVTRFDRPERAVDQQGSLRPHRVAVEDGAQVLGLWPAEKYNTSMETVIAALSQLCAANLVAVRLAFEQVVFSVLTGNGDLHAKNLSIVHHGDEWRLAPAYDLPSTLFYGDSSFALPMAGKRRDISRSQLLAFAKTLGLATPSATRVLDSLLDATGDLEADLRAGALPCDQRSVADTVASLRNRRRLLAR